MKEKITNLNISGVPVSLLSEIDKVSHIRSKAVIILITEAIEARKKKKGVRYARMQSINVARGR